MAPNQVSYSVAITNHFSSLAIEHDYPSEDGPSLEFSSEPKGDISDACPELEIVGKFRGGRQRRKGIHHFVGNNGIDIVQDGSHAVDFRKIGVASQFTAPSKFSSHYDSTTPVIDDKVLISSLSPASSDVCVSN